MSLTSLCDATTGKQGGVTCPMLPSWKLRLGGQGAPQDSTVFRVGGLPSTTSPWL